MISSNITIDNSSINTVKAKVEIINGSTFVKTCTCSDYLQDFTVNRIGEENKFFGFGICQQLKLTLIDLERELTVEKGYKIQVAYGDGTNFDYPHPPFYAEEIERDEETNSLSIVAYDKLYHATEHTVSEMAELSVPFWSTDFIKACATVIGALPAVMGNMTNILRNTLPNFDGTETIRAALNAITEASGAIYYLDKNEYIVCKQLDVSGDPVLSITRNDYFSLKTGESVTIDAICRATELGDNVIYPSDVEKGNIQYMRDNAFLTMDGDALTSVLSVLWSIVGGLTINEFICEGWAGNYLLEIGDKIALETEDGGSIYSYILNDTISFDGTLSETTQWAYDPSVAETASNPANLGEALKQTYARVDKVNQQITLVASDTSANKEAISALQITTDEINASVSSNSSDINANKEAIGALQINADNISASVSTVEKNTNDKIDGLNANIETLSKEVSVKMTPEAVRIAIESEISKGVDKVQTSTGFTFNEEGLTVSKSDSEMTTQITEDGMTISRNGQETLVANNQGVRAEDLHATTYLIIGTTSRFEDYGSNRTGCFWIGG